MFNHNYKEDKEEIFYSKFNKKSKAISDNNLKSKAISVNNEDIPIKNKYVNHPLNDPCIICFDKIYIYAEYKCKHTVCYKCCSKLIFLYKDFNCPQCNREDIVDDKRDPIKFYKKGPINKKDPIYKNNKNDSFIDEKEIDRHLYEDIYIKNSIRNLFIYRCIVCTKKKGANEEIGRENSFKSLDLLKSHYKNIHSIYLCSICILRNYQLPSEYEKYNYKEINCHIKKEHVACTFCSNEVFFNIKDCRIHAHNSHFLCTICDVMGIKYQYFNNFDDLEIHHSSCHYCCDDLLCIKNHSFAFPYKSELIAHLALVHNKIDGKAGSRTNSEDGRTSGNRGPGSYSIDISKCFVPGYPSRKEISINKNDKFRLDLSDGVVSNVSDYNISNMNTTAGIRITRPVLLDNPALPRLAANRSSAPGNGYVNDTFVKGRVKLSKESLRFCIKSENAQYLDKIYNIILRYLNGTIEDVHELIRNLEAIIKPKNIYSIFQYILYPVKEITDYMPIYKEMVKFPPFSSSKKNENKKTDDKIDEVEKLKRKFVVFDLKRFSKS